MHRAGLTGRGGNQSLLVLAALWLAAAGWGTAAPLEATFIGDLVYCDADGDGVLDPGESGLDGVEVRVRCTDAADRVCVDLTTVTGTVDPTALAELIYYPAFCQGVTTWDPTDPGEDLTGRYLVEVYRLCQLFPGPWTCTVSVVPATLPSDCSTLVTPRAGGPPADGNTDSDYCDGEDGPFPEGQPLGNAPAYGGCEANPDPVPGDGVFTVVVDPVGSDECNVYNDFGYRRQNEDCSPGYWKNHLDAWGPTGFSPGDDFDATFGVDLFAPDLTLEEAVNARGGREGKLARHGTAALLAAAHPDVNSPVTVAQVIALVQAGDSNTLAALSDLICPLD